MEAFGGYFEEQYAWLLILVGTSLRKAAPVSVRLSKIGVTMMHRVTRNIFRYE